MVEFGDRELIRETVQHRTRVVIESFVSIEEPGKGSLVKMALGLESGREFGGRRVDMDFAPPVDVSGAKPDRRAMSLADAAHGHHESCVVGSRLSDQHDRRVRE